MSLAKAYALAGVDNIRALNRAYTKEDQRLMKCRKWNYKNPALLTNQIKEIIAGLDLNELSEEEREWCHEILWFWHHHAISCAIWRYKSRREARFHAEEALRYQWEGHPNKITRLLYHLAHDQLAKAELWAKKIVHKGERETAKELIKRYKRGGFF